MKRKKQFSFNDVIEKWKQDYLSIIFLTIHYQKRLGGLRLLHYRYALVKNDVISPKWEQETKEFLGKKLKQLYYLGEIQKCITTRQNLINKLHKLVEWKILERIPETKNRDFPLYRINTENFFKIDLTLRKNRLKKLFIYNIDRSSEEKITRFENKIDDFLEIKKPEPPKIITGEEAEIFFRAT